MYSLTIDCNSTSGVPTAGSAGTGETLSLVVTYVVASGDIWLDRAWTLASFKADCSKAASATITLDPTSWLSQSDFGFRYFASFAISTSGSDNFWIDRLYLTNTTTGTVLQRWGSNNAMGYCLSTQPSDGSNAYCEAPAKPTWTFD
jgi:hypothetical protein